MEEYFTIMWGSTDIGQMVENITKIDRGVGNKWNNSLVSGTGRYGNKFRSNYLDSKTIKITFTVRGDQRRWTKLRRDLAGVLDTTTTQQLTFNDEPGVYYDAVPDGELNLDEDITTGFATGVITFLVPDGISHSSLVKTWDSTVQSDLATVVTDPDDGSITVELNSDSTATIYPKITVEMTSPNGYIGIATDEGVLAVGSQAETIITEKSNTKTNTVSEWLTKNDTRLSNQANFADWKDTFSSSTGADQPMPNPQNGDIINLDTLSFKNGSDGIRMVGLNHDPTPPSNIKFVMHSGAKFWKVPADSNGEVGASKFTSYSNMFFQATAMGQTGLIQMLYLDANKKLVCGYGLYKDDQRGNRFNIQLYIGGENQGTFRSFDNFEANNGGHGDGSVSNKNLYFNSTTGGMTIAKVGTHFTWTLSNRGGSYVYNTPDMADTKVAYAMIVIGNIKDRDMSRRNHVGNMALRQFRFQKCGIIKTTDTNTDITKVIPEDKHRFGKGEKVVIDIGAAQISRHDGTTLAMDQMITGSDFAGMSPDSKKMTFMFSDTATTPNIKIEWEEQYL